MKLLKRKIDKYLLDWKNNPKRKPLIVKGARQIGKTESIRAFGEANYESVIEITILSYCRTFGKDGLIYYKDKDKYRQGANSRYDLSKEWILNLVSVLADKAPLQVVSSSQTIHCWG